MIRAFFIALAAAAAILGLIWIVMAPAFAAWPESEFTAQQRDERRHVHRYHHSPVKRRVVKKVIIIRPQRDEGRCKAPLAIVGDQSPTENGARAQAEKAFQQEVRFRHGEIYADARNAEHITFACVDSSVRNILNRATEAVGVNSQLKRCQMKATPCAAPRVGEGQ